MEETTGSLGFSKPVLLGPIGPWLEHGGGKACDLKPHGSEIPRAPYLVPILRVLVSSVFMAEVGLGMLPKSMFCRSFLISSFSQK